MTEGILKLVALARDAGLSSRDGERGRTFVYWFDALMPEDVRAAGNADPLLDYFDSERTPHNRADEGFIDRGATTAIAFLRETGDGTG
ncbi:MAG TPA: hypothetical protein VGO55_16460 [Allosphingosinicella sp.]|jgi:hypothetical protein|nr:hypothetical protein [Allosphingosinicella sp.]